MTPAWACPKCKRRFTRKNQRHACGTGHRADILRNRPPEIVALYAALEKFAKSLGPVEFVTRERYALLRSRRIFADLVVTPDALRLVIHLPRRVRDKRFEKVAADRRHISHVVKVRRMAELEAMQPYLREAYEHSLA
jgi:predicted transport protein